MRVGYLTFGRDELGYGLEIVKRDAEYFGHTMFRVTPKTASCCDALIFSLFWWEHLFLLADFLRKAGISKENKNRPRIIIGGFSTFNPVAMLSYADAVIVGDGEGQIGYVLNGDYSSSSVLCDGKQSVSWRNENPIRPICHETNGVARIELARGCRAKCAFCAVTHLKPYRESSVDDVKACLRKTRCKRVSLFAPEPTMHSKDAEITAECRCAGKVRVDSDVRLDRLSKRSDSVPRVGIEGISEKLRRSVKKGYTDDMIVDTVGRAIMEGRKGLFMYFILDLPGETEDDWESFRILLQRIGKLPGSGSFLLKPSPSVFMPTPHTPMCGEAINWERKYGDKWEGFFGRGDEREWDVMMAERSRVFSPHMRLLQMMATRAGSEFFDVERELSKKGAISVSSGRPVISSKKLLEYVFSKRCLFDLYCGKRVSGPWDIVKING